jgi:cell division septal protein FtsQ
MLSRKKRYLQNCTGAHLKNERRDGEESPLGKIFARVLFYVLLVCFLAVTSYVLLFSTYLKISKITIIGNSELSLAEIRKVIEDQQQEKLLKIIPKDNFLLTRSGAFEKLLAGQFRKIKSVAVVKKFPDTLEITLQERKALLVFCSGDWCFLIDENGVAYSEADFNSPELTQNNLIKISDGSPEAVKLGDEIFDQAYIQYVSTLKEALQGVGIFAENDFTTPSLMADEVKVKITQGGELYFSTQFPLKNAIKTLAIILNKEPLKTQQPNLSYIDLRTENKVFYRLNNQPVAENTDNQKTDKLQ